jgi:hypothetical protein
MVEIALSIAVVAFAMVAILGVLPTGLQVQKDNREETIVNADGAYLMEAIRSGNDRAGLLSNAVYFLSLNYKNGDRDLITADNEPLGLDGQRSVGLLSTPRSTGRQGDSTTVAWVRRSAAWPSTGLLKPATGFPLPAHRRCRAVSILPPDQPTPDERARADQPPPGPPLRALTMLAAFMTTPSAAERGRRHAPAPSARSSANANRLRNQRPGMSRSVAVYYFRPSLY